MTRNIVATKKNRIEPTGKNKNSFKTDVLHLLSGTGAAQFIALLAAPIITCLYSPDAFGEAAIFLSLTGILGVLVCMRYELAIVLPELDRDAAHVFVGCLLVAFVVSLFVYGGGAFFGNFLIELDSWDEIEYFLYLLPLFVLMNGFLTAAIYWCIRFKEFKALAVSRVSASLFTIVGIVGLGIMAPQAENIVFATIGGVFLGGIMLILNILLERRDFFTDIQWRRVLLSLRRYKKFPLFSSWSALMNAISWQLPVLMLGALFSPYIAGAYALGFRVFQLPMNLVGGAIGQVFLQRAATSRDNDQLSELVEELFDYLLMFCLVPCLVLTICGEEIFSAIFGDNWAEAGVYAQILAPWMIVWFVSSPLSGVYAVLEKQEEEYILQGLILLTRIIAIGIGAYMQSALLAIVLFSFAGFISYGYLIKVIFSFCQISICRVVYRNLGMIMKSFIIVIPPFITKITGMDYYFVFVGSIISMVIYLVFYFRPLISIGNVLVD